MSTPLFRFKFVRLWVMVDDVDDDNEDDMTMMIFSRAPNSEQERFLQE